MRRLHVLAIAAASLLACTEEDPAPLYLDADYQVRCIDCEPRSADDMVRRVMALDGEAGFTVDCSTSESGGDRLLTFAATFTDAERSSDNYSFSLIQANLDASDPGGACRVVVSEGNNAYEGRCTGDEPDGENPCRVELEEADGIVMGSILCANVANKNSSMITRHIVAPNSESAARFEVHGCRGL